MSNALDELLERLGPDEPLPPLTEQEIVVLFPDYPAETECLNCSQQFGEHSLADDCDFRPNTPEERLAYARQEIRWLLERGMTARDLALAVQQTAILLSTPEE